MKGETELNPAEAQHKQDTEESQLLGSGHEGSETAKDVWHACQQSQ
jgi:hypothetical protein